MTSRSHGASRTAEPYRLYLTVEFVVATALAMILTTVIVYRVDDAGLNPFQLILVGTVLETAYFVFQLPTGFVADRVSRRLSAVTGVLVLGAALLMEGALPFFAGIAAAQVVAALGHAFLSGALESWVADELGEDGIARVYLRGTQCAQLGRLVGIVLGAVIASLQLNLPLLVAGAALLALGVVLVRVMPENVFRRDRGSASATTAEPDGATDTADMTGGASPTAATDQRAPRGTMTRAGREYVVSMAAAAWASPFLLALFAAVAFLGTWSESFDRLWGALFLDDFTFPSLGGFEPVVWLSAMTFVGALLSMGISEVVRRRVDSGGATESADTGESRTTPDAATRRLLTVLFLVTTTVLAATVLFGLTGSFAVAVLAYWAVTAVRPVYDPLVNALTVRHAPRSLRATMLSAKDMCDAGGQLIGGPAVGGVGTLVGLRASLVTAAAMLMPVCGLLLLLRRLPARRRRSRDDIPDAAAEGTGTPPRLAPPQRSATLTKEGDHAP